MTFIHELLHAIEFQRKIKVRHKAINQFEEGLYWFFRENIASMKFKKRLKPMKSVVK